MSEIINRVAQSSLITINLEDYYHEGERIFYDIKDNLFQEIVLKEADFRAFIKENDWSYYQNKNVAIGCSVDAIIPSWAYMLLVSAMNSYSNKVIIGSLAELEQQLYQEAIASIDANQYKDARVVIKGCSEKPVPLYAYGELTRVLQPHVKSLMYGEPCSTVPIFKKKIDKVSG